MARVGKLSDSLERDDSTTTFSFVSVGIDSSEPWSLSLSGDARNSLFGGREGFLLTTLATLGGRSDDFSGRGGASCGTTGALVGVVAG